jgi:gamma-glutamylcyclotransferase (GGCT)/AIG2-like uncharacterized protein YtfP
MQQMWWHEQDFRFLDHSLSRVNQARRNEEELSRCALLLEALNAAADAYFFYQKKHNLLPLLKSGSDPACNSEKLTKFLLTGLGEHGAIELCKSSSVSTLCELSAQVIEHDNGDHKQLLNAYRRFFDALSERDSQSALIEILAQQLCVGTANGVYCEKAPKEPDLHKYERDAILCSSINLVVEEIFDILWERPNTRLASYGTLRPNESNHSLVSEIDGKWIPGTIIGDLTERHGYPVFTWNVSGGKVPVEILISKDWCIHWDRLDEFEGAEYERILVPVETADGIVICNLYHACTTPAKKLESAEL